MNLQHKLLLLPHMYCLPPATLQQAKKKADSVPWAQSAWQSIEKRAKHFVESGQTVPEEAGGWIHNYICLDHWLPITFDGATLGVHHCPAGHLCEGEKLDAAWRVWRHRQITDLARDAGFAYQVRGSEICRQAVLSILLQYADFYTKFDGLSDAEPWMLKGHAFNQALTEGLWAVPLIQAYDCITETLTAEQNQRIQNELWKPLQRVMEQAQDKLIAQDKVSSNYMAWINGCLGLMGFAIQDQAMIKRAIEAPAGFKAHIDVAILADNMEFEVTPYYHNFVLLANLILAEAAAANGIDIQNHVGEQGQSNVGMGLAVANLAWPDGSLPDISEGSYWQDSIYDPELIQVYEILDGQSADGEFQQVLAAAYSRENRQRTNWAALMFGKANQPANQSADQRTNTVLSSSGLAQWRTGSKLAALATFGPYTGHHHQYDRLSLIVWPFSKDAGSPLYALPARREWYPHSYAHNTIVVDGQTHANCGGELVNWDGNQLVMSMPDAYPGIQLERTTESKDDKIFDVLTAEAESEHTFDWLFHVDGEVQPSCEMTAKSEPLGQEGAASFINLVGESVIQENVSLTIKNGEDQYQIILSGEVPFKLLLGSCPGTSRTPTQQRTVIIGRTIGQKQTYSTVIEQK
ncbi:MAG: heparinase II/III family protein [Anaerolineae bacterium]